MRRSDNKPESDDDKSRWSEEDPGWTEWTELDNLQGEMIAGDLNQRIARETEHFSYAHNRNVFDAAADFFLGSAAPDCNHPGCDLERDFAEQDSEESESWWQRWFRGSNDGNDGESGSSD